MAYSAWSVVAYEQPTTAKWNILGSNDAFFNTLVDGSGIADDAIIARHVSALDNGNMIVTNPYKFGAYKSAGNQTINTGSATKITFETEEYDTNGNFASSAYTIPVTGYYLFLASLGYDAVASGARVIPELYINGSPWKRYDDRFTNALAGQAPFAYILPASANDVIDMRATPVGANTVILSAQLKTWFQGILMCNL